MIRRVKVFISSPNDLIAEREIYKRIINELNMVLPKEYGAWIDPFFWEDQTRVIGMGLAQSRIDSPADYDLFIGMLGRRYGTPTGAIDPETGEKYMSGTEQEFKEAYRAWKASNGKKPEIKFLRKAVKEAPPDEGEEYEQYKKVEEFFAEFEVGGRHPGLPLTFISEAMFENVVREILVDYCKRTQTNAYLGHHYADVGITGLFLPGDNSLRNERKKEALRHAQHMRLVAHGGNSYLNDSAERFYPDVDELLKRGGRVQVILANPYSEMGYYLTAGNIRRRDRGKSLVELLRSKSSQQTITGITESDWVKFKLNAAIEGFLELQGTYGDRIQLKMCSYEMHSTILLTDRIAFVEPYFHCVGAERGMNAFEVCMEKKETAGNVFTVMSEYFDFLWTISEEYSRYAANVGKHQEQLMERMKDLDVLLAEDPAGE